MKSRRIISACFTFLVLASTALGYSDTDFVKILPGQQQTETLLTEDFEEDFQEFRQTTSVSIAAAANARSHDNIYDVSIQDVIEIHHARCESYIQEFLTTKPSDRLFINLGALII